MDIQEISRPLLADEVSMLKEVVEKANKKLKSKRKIYHLIIAVLISTVAMYLAIVYFKSDFWRPAFGTIASFAFVYVIFAPYEMYKAKRAKRKEFKKASDLLAGNMVKVIPVNALQMALAEEYEDEGTLYIIEYQRGQILYFEDYDNDQEEVFPCLTFEIYEEDFCQLTWRQLRPLGEKINPNIIPGKAKWAYMKNNHWPAHLTTVTGNFEEIVSQFKGQETTV